LLTPGCCWRNLAFLFLLCSGAGFASQDVFLHGFFSAAIKLPADYAAGVVVAFYVSRREPTKPVPQDLSPVQ